MKRWECVVIVGLLVITINAVGQALTSPTLPALSVSLFLGLLTPNFLGIGATLLAIVACLVPASRGKAPNLN